MSFYCCYALFSNCHIKTGVSAANIFPKWFREMMRWRWSRCYYTVQVTKRSSMFVWNAWNNTYMFKCVQTEIRCHIIHMYTRVKCSLVSSAFLCLFKDYIYMYMNLYLFFVLFVITLLMWFRFYPLSLLLMLKWQR